MTLDGKKLILPDLSGNRFLTSLGNVETDQHVGLVLPDFKTGSILYVTGLGINHVGEEAKKIMLRTNLLTEIQVTGFIFVENALPFREAPGTLESSPYSPPIKYLTTEANQPMIQNNVGIKLIGIEMHSNNLATFKFETSKPIQYKSGQYAILDLKELLGDIGYVHLSKGDEKSPNEDGVRTWLVSFFFRSKIEKFSSSRKKKSLTLHFCWINIGQSHQLHQTMNQQTSSRLQFNKYIEVE